MSARVASGIGGAVLAAVFLAFPYVASGYWVRVITSAFMYATMACAVNLITGFAGYAALGNVVFFGVGAYAMAYAMGTWQWSSFSGALFGGLVAAAYAALVGVPILKTKGHYFVMATIGLAEFTREIVLNLEFTRGAAGLSLPIPRLSPEEFFRAIYYAMGLLLVVCTLTVWAIARSRLGYGLRAIRSDEEAAMVMGVPTTLYKVTAWVIGAFFTGVAGAIYAYWTTFIEPAAVFNIVIAVKVFVMMMLGGMGTVAGPLLGSFILEIISELVWGRFTDLHLGILGILVLLIVLLLPRGLIFYVRPRALFRWAGARPQEGRV